MYEKQTWVTGEVITKEKLNHMEDGIANSGGVIVAEEDLNWQLNKTWQEICDALNERKQVYIYAVRLLNKDGIETYFEPVCSAKKVFVGVSDIEDEGYDHYLYTPTKIYSSGSNEDSYPMFYEDLNDKQDETEG